MLEKALSKHPNNLDLMFYLAHSYFQAGREINRCEELALKLVERKPLTMKFSAILGKVLFYREKYEQASVALQAAEQLLCKSYSFLNKPHAKQRTDLLFMIGLCFEKLDAEKESVEFYEKALKLRPV